ncbi:hypothetical protein [uncultured Phascolarctobacterium sp.]|uniref:hypothetical protein n=1 Tax=uncultured Phascolarctobacterium sp. TaxID=512296 RepID=UPI0025DFD1CB|nr:hypothetical protein [uncultured Phascolarctobacterium sp.]
MNKEFTKEVEKIIRVNLGNNNFRWSSTVGLYKDKETVVMLITGDHYKENMQNNAACFEGWAAVLKTYFMDKNYNFVKLKCVEIPSPSPEKGILENEHANRFLYRALRFSQQYKDWFRLEDDLQGKVNEFEKYLEGHKGEHKEKLLNNLPGDKFDGEYKNDGINMFTESIMEKFIYEHKEDVLSPLFKDSKNIIVNRQMPVGLFEGSVEKQNKIFTGGKSAIDLWAYDPAKPEEFSVFELKFQNKMIGIISEIFFYANYMYDLLNKQGSFTLNVKEDDASAKRGYGTLIKECNDKIEKINAVMLADYENMHPVITSKLLETLNGNDGRRIKYSAEKYKVGRIEVVGDIEILNNN